MVDRQRRFARQLKPAFRYMKKHLNKLKVKCRYQINGCSEITKLEGIEAHDCIWVNCTKCGTMPANIIRLQNENRSLQDQIKSVTKVS